MLSLQLALLLAVASAPVQSPAATSSPSKSPTGQAPSGGVRGGHAKAYCHHFITGAAERSVVEGSLFLVDEATLGGKKLNEFTSPVTGLAVGPDGRLWGTRRGSFSTWLMQLDPETGAELSSVKIVDNNGDEIAMRDIACDPLTGKLYGFGLSHFGGVGRFYEIDVETGAADNLGTMQPAGPSASLTFHPDGTLYWMVDSKLSVYVDWVLVSTIDVTPYRRFDALAVRPTDGKLFGARAEVVGDELYEIDPVTGDATFVGLLETGAAASLAFVPCPVESDVTVRLGTPPNPNVYLPGPTPPTLGTTWEPRVDHTSFLPNALFDFAAFSAAPVNVPMPFGVLLCDLPHVGAQIVPKGEPFAFPVPAELSLAGLSLCTQAGSADASTLAVTNALDLVLGTS
ncbi:MAG: hypothetical protein AAF682_31770 [Planctomycetota bacterium]